MMGQLAPAFHRRLSHPIRNHVSLRAVAIRRDEFYVLAKSLRTFEESTSYEPLPDDQHNTYIHVLRIYPRRDENEVECDQARNI